jgi:hypothetical protein
MRGRIVDNAELDRHLAVTPAHLHGLASTLNHTNLLVSDLDKTHRHRELRQGPRTAAEPGRQEAGRPAT